MEFLCEIIFEVILEGIFGLTVGNPKVKTWAKTAFFVLFCTAFSLFIAWMGWTHYQNGNRSGGIVCLVLAAAMEVGFLLLAVYGHKRGWKQK